MRIKFWGVRGSTPTPQPENLRYGGNTSCVEVRLGDSVFIFDCGTGFRSLGQQLRHEFNSRTVSAHIFVSHFHWDHIQGIPFFGPLYDKPENRFIFHSSSRTRSLKRVMEEQMASPYFPVDLNEMKAKREFHELDEGRVSLDDVTVQAAWLNHPQGCMGFRLESKQGVVVYATDNEVELEPSRPESDGQAKLRIARPALVKFVRNADLLIADGQYTDTEYTSKQGWGHTSCLTAVDLAVQAGAKHLAIFHHDPAHADSFVDEIIENCRRRIKSFDSELIVFAAREGMELEV